MLKMARRARGHFVMLIEICMHLIRVKPGHILVDIKHNHQLGTGKIRAPHGI